MTDNQEFDAYHEFESFDGASGFVCTRMVMKSGEADDCGLPADMHPVFWVGAGLVLVVKDGIPRPYTRNRA